ncbi:non-canonical purine NTP pyrophosphatase, RdgB/HAM1 family protein (macronuclear) [Tetrahymena thermophila SB210]|uniref:XTP/dITP diphosphatase n=1 Tax=Tetrahymena thermophila (strain SB210) TaxID=312017 RepID=Q240T6_TETTS|nr:non-canonical purine NTP pyrophosphatase, RdgB/HAM1 family protein [Tetrahymena thermophila SB210]EAS02328.1 non-canonical purine NTP pyrophosphatase, RdgB/HAM1 family protein [Tetrahymena thermophila SB210]|eukprot:XP_001022573.1 non-canonical purine NTP pyrophosphatase, RdgB/HAM1 family protein [Tetrahymena thermophila SB210]
MRKATKEILLITGNKDKLSEFQSILSNSSLSLTSINIDLPEYQGSPLDIAKMKAKFAFNIVKKPLIVEDASLCFNALNGLPGPYIKWFLKELKPAGVVKMLAGYEDKSAYAQCIIAYMSEELEDPLCFIGQTPGLITLPSSPIQGWNQNSSWPFQPEGYSQTYQELPADVKNKISHRSRAIHKMIEYFENLQQAENTQPQA